MISRDLVCLAVFLCAADFALAQTTLSEAGHDLTNAEIERLLDQKRDMVFEDATLEEFVAFLETSGVPTHIERRALDEIGVSTDTPITFRQHAIRLRDGLKFVLDEIDLTATPRNGRLVISTPEWDEDRLITKVYDVRNLVALVPIWNGGFFFGGAPTQVGYQYDFDALVDLILDTIMPNTWDEVGGPGRIEPHYTRRMRVIVVSQTYEVHRQIQALLDTLATHGGSTPLPTISTYKPPQPRPKTFVRSPARQPLRRRVEIRSSQLRTTGQ